MPPRHLAESGQEKLAPEPMGSRKKPTAEIAHEEDPGMASDSGEHGVQLVVPAEEAAFPASQFRHLVAPVDENLPATHEEQLKEPALLAVPASHVWQLVAPAEEAAFPASQSRHLVAPVDENLPAAHEEQAEEPGLLVVPASHV